MPDERRLRQLVSVRPPVDWWGALQPLLALGRGERDGTVWRRTNLFRRLIPKGQ